MKNPILLLYIHELNLFITFVLRIINRIIQKTVNPEKTGWLPFSLFAAADVERVRLLSRVADAVRILGLDPELVARAGN